VRNGKLIHWRGKRQTVTSTYSEPHIIYAETAKENVENGSKSLKNVQINDWRVMNITKFVASQVMTSDTSIPIPNETKVDLKSKGDLPIISNKPVKVPYKLVESEPKPEYEALLPAFHVTYWMFYPYSQVSIFKLGKYPAI
jgi:hypothetical protein